MMPFFLSLQLIYLRGDHHQRPPVGHEPISQLDILFHPAPPRIQDDNCQAQRTAVEQIPLDQRLPFIGNSLGELCEPIPRQVNQSQPAVHLEEIDELRTTRPGTDSSQTIFTGAAGPHQRVQ
jgi:hypothetical protein